MKIRFALSLLGLLLLMASSTALAGDYVDVNVNMMMADDNINESSQFSPDFDIHTRPDSEFSESGRGSRSHLVVYKRMEGFWKGVYTEAALVLKLNIFQQESGTVGTAIKEDGTYAQIGYMFSYTPVAESENGSSDDDPLVNWLEEDEEGKASQAPQSENGTAQAPQGEAPEAAPAEPTAKKDIWKQPAKVKDVTQIYITAFPFDADAFQLGFHKELTWGGATMFPQNDDLVPGVRLAFECPYAYAFAGMKTHRQPVKDKQNTERVPYETVYGGLFGVGTDFFAPFASLKKDHSLKLEINGGIFDKGDNVVIPERDGKEDADDINAYGVASRLSYTYGLPIGERLDLDLYQNDPRTRIAEIKGERVEKYNDRYSTSVSIEADYLSEDLSDPDKVNGTKAFNAMAARLDSKHKFPMDFEGMAYGRVHLFYQYRTLEYLLFNGPGYVPFEAFPKGSESKPEQKFGLAYDVFIKPAHLTMSVFVEHQLPASYKGSSDQTNTAVIKDRTDSSAYLSAFSRNIEILPEGKDPFGITTFKFTVKEDFSQMLSMAFELTYQVDRNRPRYEASEEDDKTLVKVFEDKSVTDRLGLALLIQAKF